MGIMAPGVGAPSPIQRFAGAQQHPTRYVISGVTRDSSGNPLASCTVQILEGASGMMRGQTTSDANGAYTFDVTSAETGLTFGVVAYSSDGTKAGATVETLTGTPS